ncbi:MAG: hypothetical protein LC115_01365 [Bacteroidia bacterium]|nr:hypothetical protein [Bacteroidia bacterium]
MIKELFKTVSYGVVGLAAIMLLIGYFSNQASLSKRDFAKEKTLFKYYGTWTVLSEDRADSISLMLKRDPEVRINVVVSPAGSNTTFAPDFIQNIHNSQVFSDYKPMKVSQTKVGKFEKSTRIDFSFIDKHANPTQVPTVFLGTDWIIEQSGKQVVLSLIAPADKHTNFLTDLTLISNTISF